MTTVQERYTSAQLTAVAEFAEYLANSMGEDVIMGHLSDFLYHDADTEDEPTTAETDDFNAWMTFVRGCALPEPAAAIGDMFGLLWHGAHDEAERVRLPMYIVAAEDPYDDGDGPELTYTPAQDFRVSFGKRWTPILTVLPANYTHDGATYSE